MSDQKLRDDLAQAMLLNRGAAILAIPATPIAERLTVHGVEIATLSALHCIYRGRLSRQPGARMLPAGVNCARPGRWGNPYRVGRDGDAHRSIRLFTETTLLYWQRVEANFPGVTSLGKLVARYRQHGHLILYCWCKLGDPCHCRPLADALVAELERQE